jgi:hypothetical protein
VGIEGEYTVKSAAAPDGHSVMMMSIQGNAKPHFHLKSTSFFTFADEMFIPEGTSLNEGAWCLEPVGAIHPSTQFRECVYGFGMSEGDGGAGAVPLPNGIPDRLLEE